MINLEEKQKIQSVLYPWILFSILKARGVRFGKSKLVSCVPDQPSVVYDSASGSLEFVQGEGPVAGFGFHFKNPGQAIAMFEDGAIAPSAFRGFAPLKWPVFLSGLLKVQADMASSKWEKKADLELLRKSLVLLQSAVFGIDGLGRINAFSRQQLEHIPNGVIRIRVGDSPVLACVGIDSGKIQWIDDDRDFPGKSVDFAFKNVRSAWLSASNLADNLAAVGKGDIVLSGYIPIVDGFNHMLDRLQMYVSSS